MTLFVQRALFPETRVSPKTLKSSTPLESDDDDDDDDSLTLSKFLGSPPPPVHHGPFGPPGKRQKRKHQDSRVSKKKRSCDFSGDEPNPATKRCKNAIPRRDFKNGDLVWAKAFPYSWWPGCVERIKKSSALVSFFGFEKTRSFRLREIRGFEEWYPQISKLVRVKLADEISLALEELSRRTVIGLSCGMQEASGMSSNQISEVKEGFDPIDVLGFVGDLAVSACVPYEETASAVRMSSQVYAFRRYVSVGQYSGVDDGLNSTTLLDFVHELAITSCNDVDAAASEEAAWLSGFRRFVSVCPGWMYQGTTGLEDDLLIEESEGEQLMSDSSDRGEVSRNFEGEISSNTLRMDWEDNEQQVPDGRELCLLNTADFSLLDIDEDYDSLLDNQLEVVTGWDNSTLEDIYLSENLVMQRSCTSKSIEDEDFYIAQDKNLSDMRHSEQSADDGICENVQLDRILVDQLDLNDIASGHILAYDSKSESSLETEDQKKEGVVKMHIEHETGDSAAVPVTFVDSYLLQTAPVAERQLTKYLPKPVEFIEPQPSSQSSFNISLVLHNEAATRGIINTISSLASSSKSPRMNILKKGMCGSPFQNFFKLHKSLTPYAEAKSYAKLFAKYISFTGNEDFSYDEVINENNVAGKNLLLANADNDVKFLSLNNYSSASSTLSGRNVSMKGSSYLTLPKFTSKEKMHQKKKHDRPFVSDHSKWTGLYSSPLIREKSKSFSKDQKSLLLDKSNNSSKTLHMKFPKDFNLPSREELEKKFRVFGPLDCSRTRLFFYTGAAQVVFFYQTDADAAYKYVKKKNVFGNANVRFWFDEYEKFRKGVSCHNHPSLRKEGDSLLEKSPSSEGLDVHQKKNNSTCTVSAPEGLDVHQKKNKNSTRTVSAPVISVPVRWSSPSDLKSCLKSPDALERKDNKKTCKVRFTIET